MTTVWIDASAGVAGDMLLAALLDAGAALDEVRAAVEAVVPNEIALHTSEVTRAGLRARRVEVASAVREHPHRSWPEVRALLVRAGLPDAVRDRALAVFARLAEAEARVHGVAAEAVRFHEVGAWDSIADVVGVCAALGSLNADVVVSGPVALGSGHVDGAHGRLPVPVPAVLDLARGHDVAAGAGAGELATPTGMALLAVLSTSTGPLPAMRVAATGVGAGARDTPGHANVVRVVLGDTADDPTEETMWVLETNVDDLDPRVWPDVLAGLLAAGAADAWLTPIVMKKGRPAHTLSVLAHEPDRAALRDAVVDLTPTLGVRESTVRRTAVERAWHAVHLGDGTVRVKLGLRAGRIVTATPEFDDTAALARARAVPVRRVLDDAVAAARAASLHPGTAWPREEDEG